VLVNNEQHLRARRRKRRFRGHLDGDATTVVTMEAEFD
jgi:hypothetical protein